MTTAAEDSGHSHGEKEAQKPDSRQRIVSHISRCFRHAGLQPAGFTSFARGLARCPGSDRRRGRPPCPVRADTAPHRRPRGRRPVPDGRRLPGGRPSPRLSALYPDLPPVHATAVWHTGVSGAPVQCRAGRARLRGRVRLCASVGGLRRTGADRGLAVRRLGTRLVPGDHRRGLYPECTVVFRPLRLGVGRRPAAPTDVDLAHGRGRLRAEFGQPLAADGAGHPRASDGGVAGLAGPAAALAAAPGRLSVECRAALRVDGLALASESVFQLLRTDRQFAGTVVLHQPERVFAY